MKNGDLESVPDEIIIRVTGNGTEGNNKPVAVAGQDQRVTIGSEVLLSGSASKDIDDDDLTYRWELISKPHNSHVSISDTSHVELSFIPDVEGEYLFQLMLNDGMINSIPDTLKVMAVAINVPPNKICIPNAISSKSCNVDNGLGTQIRACSVNGLAWGSYEGCTVTNCNTGYRKVGNICVIDAITQICTPNSSESKVCDIDNGSGSKNRACSADGLVWGDYESCTVTTCDSGYQKEGNTCVIDAPTQVCTPDSTESQNCAIDNGSGTQARTCATNGLAWGAYDGCKVTSCSTAYHQVKNTCIENAQNNTPPVVNAGNDKILNEGELALFLATASDDEEIVKVEWFDKDSHVLGSELGLVLTNLGLGDHIFMVKVTDNGGLTATDEIKVTINKDVTLPGTLSGKVIDKNGVAIANAKVQVGTGETTTTNNIGVYSFVNLKPIEESTITALANSYLQKSEIIVVESGRETIRNIVLPRPETIEIIDPNEEEVIVADSLTIKIPVDALVDKQGNKIEGDITVSVSFSPSDVEDTDEYIAKNDDGEIAYLNPIGIVRSEFKDKSGNDIVLKEGKEIEVEIPSEDWSGDPEDLIIWVLDEEIGIWKPFSGVAHFELDTLRKKIIIKFKPPVIKPRFDECAGRPIESRCKREANDPIPKTVVVSKSPTPFSSLEVCVEDAQNNRVASRLILQSGKDKAKVRYSEISNTGIFLIKRIIPLVKNKIYASTSDGGLGAYKNNPFSLTVGENKFNKCIIVDSNNNTENVNFTGTLVDSNGVAKPDVEIRLYDENGRYGQIEIGHVKTDMNGSFELNLDKTHPTIVDFSLSGEKIINLKVISGEEYSNFEQKIALEEGKLSYDLGTLSLVLNIPPVANAGLNQIVYAGEPVKLSASGSYDPDGVIKTYEWREVTGEKRLLKIGSDTSNSYDYYQYNSGTHVIELIVTDDRGEKSRDEIIITVVNDNKDLIVDAGTNKNIYLGQSVDLFGTGNYTADSILAWYDNGYKIGLDSEPNITYTGVTLGRHELTFSVIENNKEKKDKVIVNVIEKERFLFVNAGLDRSFYDDGSDHDLYINVQSNGASQLYYEWTENGQLLPFGDHKDLPYKGSIGTHTLKVTVRNDNGDEKTDTVEITIEEYTGSEVNLGVNFSVYEGSSVYLSSEFLGDIYEQLDEPITYSWWENGREIPELYGTDASLGSHWKAGEIHTIAFYVDGENTRWHGRRPEQGHGPTGRSNIFDEITISVVKDDRLHIQNADAGLDKVIYLGESVILDGTNSSVYPSTTIDYRWVEGGNELVQTTPGKVLYEGLQLGSHQITMSFSVNGVEETDDVIVSVIPFPTEPQLHADAGLDKTIYLGEALYLDAKKRSYSTIGSIKHYKWTKDDIILSESNWDSELRYTPQTVGQHEIILEVTDSRGITDSDKVIISVVSKDAVDKTPPIITFNGAEEITVHQGDIYIELGAIAVDDRDGILTESIIITNAIKDTFTVGSFDVTYTSKDKMGNEASITRIVNIVPQLEADTTSPVIILIGENPATILQGQLYNDAGASVIDDRDGKINYSFEDNVDTNILGSYEFNYFATDKAGNNRKVTRTVIVEKDITENIPPSASAGSDQTVYEGNTVNFDGSASTDSDGSIVSYEWTENNVVLSSAASFSKNDFSVGTHTVQLKVTDAEGLSDIDTLIITVNGKTTEHQMQICPVTRITNDASFLDVYPNDNIDWIGNDYTSVVEIEKAFNNARLIDNSVFQYLKLPSQSVWDGMSAQEQGLYLINSERQARGIKPYEGVSQNVVSVAQQYSDYIRINNQVIGHQNDGNTPAERLDEDVLILENRDDTFYPESIFAGFGTRALPSDKEIVVQAVYNWIYADKEPLIGTAWGHRDHLIQKGLNENSGETYKEGLIGFGISKGDYDPTNTQPDYVGYVVVLNSFDPSAGWDHASTQMVSIDSAQLCNDNIVISIDESLVSVDQLVSLVVSPTDISLTVGLTEQLQVLGTYQDGTQLDLSSAVSFIPDSRSIVSVDAGLITAVRNGNVNITVQANEISSNKVGVLVSDYIINNAGIDVSELRTEFTSDYEFVQLNTANQVKFRFDIKLKSKPRADVSIQVISSDVNQGTVDLTPHSVDGYLTFTPYNWDQAQTVTIVSDEADTLAGNLDFTVQVLPAESYDDHYAGLDPDDITISNTAPTLSVGTLEQLDFVGGVYQWEAIQFNYTGKDEVVLSLENAPVGMTLENGRISWLPSVADGGSSYNITIRASAGELTDEKQFTIDVATTSPIQKVLDGNSLKFIDSDCNFSVLGFGEFKITAKDSDTTELGNLTINKVISEVDYNLPAGVKRHSCFFTINPPPAQENITGDYKITLPIDIDKLSTGEPLINVVLYMYNSIASPHSGSTKNKWIPLIGKVVQDVGGDTYIELDYPYSKGLFFIGNSSLFPMVDPQRLSQDNSEQKNSIFSSTVLASNSYCQQQSTLVRPPESRHIPLFPKDSYIMENYQLCEKPGFLKVNVINFNKAKNLRENINNIFTYLLQAQDAVSTRLGFHAPKGEFDLIFEDIKDAGLMLPKNNRGGDLFKFVMKIDTNLLLPVKYTIAHEYFHSAQYATFLGNSPINTNYMNWVVEGQAKWFEDFLYDSENPYNFDGKGFPILSVGLKSLANDFVKDIPRGVNNPYQRFTFHKMLDTKCSFYSENTRAFKILETLSDGKDGLQKLSQFFANCNFGSQLNNPSSIASALLFYQYATQLENKMSLLDSNENDNFKFVEPLSFDAHPSDYIWNLEIDNIAYDDGAVAKKLPPFGAITGRFNPKKLKVIDSKSLTLVVESSQSLMVSVASKEALYNEVNKLGSFSHVWFKTVLKEDGSGFIGEYKLDPDELSPDMFVTLINESTTNTAENLKVILKLSSRHLLWTKLIPSESKCTSDNLGAIPYLPHSKIPKQAKLDSALVIKIDACLNKSITTNFSKDDLCTVKKINKLSVDNRIKVEQCLDNLMRSTYGSKLQPINRTDGIGGDSTATETYYTLERKLN